MFVKATVSEVTVTVSERSRNYVFDEDTPPTVPMARVLIYALGAYKVLLKALS
jgi:hypothetical protein